MIAFLRQRRPVLLAVFMAAELAVLFFVLAQHVWPRAIPEAVGWTVYFGSYPWSMPWLAADRDEPAATMAIVSASFALNVTLAAALAWYAVAHWRRGGEAA